MHFWSYLYPIALEFDQKSANLTEQLLTSSQWLHGLDFALISGGVCMLAVAQRVGKFKITFY